MEVGALAESVTVSGQTALLNTTSAEGKHRPDGEVVHGPAIVDLLAIGVGHRSPPDRQFISLTPGTGASDPDNLWASDSTGLPMMNEVLIDGRRHGENSGGVIETNARPMSPWKSSKFKR